MTDITVKNILALIHSNQARLGDNVEEEDILYIVFPGKGSWKAVDTITYKVISGGDIHLDINEDGFVIGIEFY